MGVYGRELQIIKSMNIGGCIDAAIEGNLLYIIGSEKYEDTDYIDLEGGYNSGHLYIADITDKTAPSIIGKLNRLGNTRKLKVKNGIVYVASREDGLFIIDATDLSNLKVLSHYDTIEYATGIDVCGEYAFVACGRFGVEIIDISNVAKPEHINTVRAGDVQSVYIYNGYMYAGLWGQMELAVCDIRNPYKPGIAAKLLIDGRGDGVFVEGNYCYVATGHHARGMIRESESDPAYGKGNGLEIFDISNPEKPEFVSRIKINRFYKMFNNLWNVIVCDNFAFLTHTYNGIFVIDVSEPHMPKFTAHVKLPQDKKKQWQNPVGGIALTDGLIYAAGICSDLYIVEASGLAKNVIRTGDEFNYSTHGLQACTSYEQEYMISGVNASGTQIIKANLYKPRGQVYSVGLTDRFAFAACGSEGIHVVETGDKIRKAAEYATKGFAMDIKVIGDLIYIAEGNGGLSVWKLYEDYKMEVIGYYNAYGSSVKQVVIPQDSKYALLHVGSKWLHIIDISNPEYMRMVMADSQEEGLLYGRQIGDGLVKGRYASCFWHVSGIYWYDICVKPQPKFAGYCQEQRLNIPDGIAYTPTHAVLTYKKGYVLIDYTNSGNLDDLHQYTVKGFDLTGKPSIYDNIMFISDRAGGNINVLDISDIENPKIVIHFKIDGNPDIIVKHKDKVAIPAGYQGLFITDCDMLLNK